MSNPVIYNRRLGKNELDILLDLLDNYKIAKTTNRSQAKIFFQMEDAIAFISTIENEPIGGTVVYRDRTRLGMVLAAIAIKDEYRDLVTYPVIKSSLPFFRTVAIRDVDVIVSANSHSLNLSFPHSFYLPSWTQPILERAGFERECDLFTYLLEFSNHDIQTPRENLLDADVNMEGARSLIWDEGKDAGLTNSIVWMSLDYAMHAKSLHTVTNENKTDLVFSSYNYDDVATIGFIVTTQEFTRNNAAAEVLSSTILNTKAAKIRFPLIGKGQEELLKSIANQVGGFLKKQSITLMRRRL